MSGQKTLFIGPYAEFPVPAGREGEFPPEDDEQQYLFWEQLICNCWDGYQGDCYRYTPNKPRTLGGKRDMYYWGDFMEDQDLTELDRQAEMNWFSTTYADPLLALSNLYGLPPRIRWGIVFWQS